MPVVALSQALNARGHEVTLAYREPEKTDSPDALRLQHAIEAAGVKGTTELALNRYMGIGDTLHDWRRLPQMVKEGDFDIVHCHLSHDHALASVVLGRMGRKRPIVVRSLHQRKVLSDKILNRILLKKLTDGYVVFTEGFRQKYIHRFDLPADHVALAPPVLELARYNPDAQFKDMRSEFGVNDDHVLIGIVARFQKYRRMDVFFEAAVEAVKKQPNLRFLVIGRSSQYQQTVVEPVERHGLKDHVILAGYRRDDYLDTLASLDVATLLMPGSDGTARAIREAMALARPCVVSDVGMLPEIMPHEKAGLVVPLEAQPLAEAWCRLAQDATLRKQMGQTGRSIAVEQFDASLAAERVETLYNTLAAKRA